MCGSCAPEGGERKKGIRERKRKRKKRKEKEKQKRKRKGKEKEKKKKRSSHTSGTFAILSEVTICSVMGTLMMDFQKEGRGGKIKVKNPNNKTQNTGYWNWDFVIYYLMNKGMLYK